MGADISGPGAVHDAGLALFYGGMDRSRNVLNMLAMNFWCLLAIPVLWVVVGYSLMTGSNKFIGNFDFAFLNGMGIGAEDGDQPAVRGVPGDVRGDHPAR